MTQRTAPGGLTRAREAWRLKRGRPELYTDYAADQAMLNTPTKRWATVALVALLAALPVIAPDAMDRDRLSLLTLVFIYVIGGIGQNLVTGYAGQVSLGHAFFLGLGAYTATFVGGEGTQSLRGLGLEMWVWLPAAGLVPAAVGFAVAPLAARVRGLYLAIVTLGLVFLGEHVFRVSRTLTGGAGVGRRAAPAEVAGFSFGRGGSQEFFWLCLALAVALAVVAKNLARSKDGRAFAAVRDRDLAASVMGVPLTRTKVWAFTVSSFYAGIAGALLATHLTHVQPEFFNIFLSVEFLAVILIGGVATISGSILGAVFVVLLPRFVQTLSGQVPFISGPGAEGPVLVTTFQLETILFGGLIVLFLVLEPRGLFGLWLRVRNYWKAWPFSY